MKDTASPQLEIEVCSRDEAGAILTSPEQRAGIVFLISISDPDLDPPLGYDDVTDKARLLFVDADDETGPTREDVRQVIELARTLLDRSGRVLIHCLGGISRSTATAIILRVMILGSGHEAEAVRAVVEQRPIARPNRRMIAFADELLGLDGRLTAAAATVVSG